MKKLFLTGLTFIVIGYFLGNYIFNIKVNLFDTSNDKYYFIKNKTTNEYLAITKDLEIVERLQIIYKTQGIKSLVLEKEINSTVLASNIKQFDRLVKTATKEQDIITIEEVVLANYKKISSIT
ncbi:MAG: hypothetical protein IJG97_02440 [Bacilli bacterium]|nr:hypothetical protein [Bacilli bacterium]